MMIDLFTTLPQPRTTANWDSKTAAQILEEFTRLCAELVHDTTHFNCRCMLSPAMLAWWRGPLHQRMEYVAGKRPCKPGAFQRAYQYNRKARTAR